MALLSLALVKLAIAWKMRSGRKSGTLPPMISARAWSVLSGEPAILTSRAPVGQVAGVVPTSGQVAGLIVGSDEIETLDGKIRNLNTDVQSQGKDPVLMLAWTDFFARWEAWRSIHTSFLAQSGLPNFESGLGGNVAAEFEAFVGEYNEKRRLFLAQGLKTDAGRDSSLDSPLQKAWDFGTSAVGTIGMIALLGAAAYVGYELYESHKAGSRA